MPDTLNISPNIISYSAMFRPDGPTVYPEVLPKFQAPSITTIFDDSISATVNKIASEVMLSTTSNERRLSSSCDGFNASNPFYSSILSAKYLTSADSDRKVLNIDLDISNSGFLSIFL